MELAAVEFDLAVREDDCGAGVCCQGEADVQVSDSLRASFLGWRRDGEIRLRRPHGMTWPAMHAADFLL